MSAAHKGTAQMARDAVAEACRSVGLGGPMLVPPNVLNRLLRAAIDGLNGGFQKIDASVFVDLDSEPSAGGDDRLPLALAMANDQASVSLPLTWTARVLRIDRSAFNQIDIIVLRAAPDAGERTVRAFGEIIAHFDAWSVGQRSRNGHR